MHNAELILTLTGGLAAALILGYISHRLGLSPIVGYLLGGFAVGPHTPGFVANKELADQLAEVGVILLMFGVGLQFHFNEIDVREVYLPIRQELRVSRPEMRSYYPTRKSAPTNGAF